MNDICLSESGISNCLFTELTSSVLSLYRATDSTQLQTCRNQKRFGVTLKEPNPTRQVSVQQRTKVQKVARPNSRAAPVRRKRLALYTSMTCKSSASQALFNLVCFTLPMPVEVNCIPSVLGCPPFSCKCCHLTGSQRVDIQVFTMKLLVLVLKTNHPA